MNDESLNEAFHRGELRVIGMSQSSIGHSTASMVRTDDGFTTIYDQVDDLQSKRHQVRLFADPTRLHLGVSRPDGHGGFECRALYVEFKDSRAVDAEQLTPPATVDSSAEVGDPDDQGTFGASVEPGPPARQPRNEHGPVIEKETPPAAPEKRPEPPSISVPIQRQKQQASLGLEVSADHASEQADIRLVHEMLTDYHANRLVWYEDFMARIRRDGANHGRVLQMLCGDGMGDDNNDWADTTMTMGLSLSWDGLPRIRASLPLKKRMIVIGRVDGVEAPESKRIRVTHEHLVTKIHAPELAMLTSDGKHKTLVLRADSSDLYKRALLYCDRGQVRFKLRLSRGLAIERRPEAVIEDAYLENVEDQQIDDHIQWIAEALRRRPPREPEWVERSL